MCLVCRAGFVIAFWRSAGTPLYRHRLDPCGAPRPLSHAVVRAPGAPQPLGLAAVTICYHLARFHHCLPGQPSPPPPRRTRLRRCMACCSQPLERSAPGSCEQWHGLCKRQEARCSRDKPQARDPRHSKVARGSPSCVSAHRLASVRRSGHWHWGGADVGDGVAGEGSHTVGERVNASSMLSERMAYGEKSS